MPVLPLLHAALFSAASLHTPEAYGTRRRAIQTAATAAVLPTLPLPACALADRVGPDGRLVLTDKSAATIDVVQDPPRTTSRCYFDLSIGKVPAGRIVIDLYGEIAPKAAGMLSLQSEPRCRLNEGNLRSPPLARLQRTSEHYARGRKVSAMPGPLSTG